MISAYLKEQTKPLHDALEQKMMVEKIFNKTLSKEDYLKILKVNLSVHKTVEPIIENQLKEDTKNELQFEKRRKLPKLQSDFPISEDFPELSFSLANQQEALGALYVLEGATLGGNVIKKQLLQNPEFQNQSFQYYGIYGEKLSGMWKNFLEVLEQNIGESQKDDALNGAEKTYRLFLNSAESII